MNHTEPTLAARLREKAATYDWTGQGTADLLKEAAAEIDTLQAVVARMAERAEIRSRKLAEVRQAAQPEAQAASNGTGAYKREAYWWKGGERVVLRTGGPIMEVVGMDDGWLTCRWEVFTHYETSKGFSERRFNPATLYRVVE